MIQLPKLYWNASPNYSSRGGKRITRIVIHDCEGSFLGSIAQFKLVTIPNPVSVHYLLKEDGLECVQMVELPNKAWHACSANPWSVGIEAAGYSKRGFAEAEWQALASITAFLLKELDIPPFWSNDTAGSPGFCSHYDLGVFGGGHTDPTTDKAVWQHFVDLVKTTYAMELPTEWPIVNTMDVAKLMVPKTYTPSNTKRDDLQPYTLEWAQAAMNKFGYHMRGVLTIDGIYGNETKSALMAYQSSRRLKYVDGLPGPETFGQIDKDLKDAKP